MQQGEDSPSKMSALHSLATYTDSEEEDLEEEQEDAVRGDEPPLRPDSPTELNESKDQSDSVPGGVGLGPDTGKSTSGLVSYHLDDQIDDDAVDDYDYQSDSLSEKDEETKAKTSGEDESKSPGVEPEQEQENDESLSAAESNLKIKIPPEPSGHPNAELLERFKTLHAVKLKKGLNMNMHIQRNKQFRNPSIYEKLIKHCNIDELGTNYPSEIYNPHEWKEASFYDELAKFQKADMERREKEKKERTKVEFISGTAVKKPNSAPLVGNPLQGTAGPNFAGLSAAASALEADNKRKSKWDQRGAVINVPHNFSGTQSNLMQPNIATAVTGTKSTVINAFGNLPKKPKQ